jgi:nitrogen-specific signal transduction histidine kinase/FixJ family two-component response regulator
MEATRGGPRPDQGESRRLELSSLADFAAGLAHEINNPLAIIIEAAGWVEDLLEDEETSGANLEEMRRSLRQIATQAGRCKEITHNLLSFARRVPGRIYDVDLNELVREVAATFEKRAGSRRVAIALHLDEGLPRRRLSPTAIQQLLVNLLNNALDALESASLPDPSLAGGRGREGGRIDVSTRRDGGDVLLEVADDGPGIPEAVVRRIFDPFFTTKPVGKGTGLGLSICYGIAEDMGGSIAVESREGRGTTFRVRIPERPAGEGDQPARIHLEEDDPGYGIAPRSPTVVLLVDNEEGFVETVAKRLERRNLVVLTARSGQEAIARLEAHGAVDVVVLDVKLPDMDGTEVLRESKRRAPLVEVILLSGHSTVETAIDGMRLGAFDYLVKPCELGLLLSQIDKARAKKARQEERIMEARLKEITMRRA